jgi:isopenicillin N synthase-like dioxygenase
MIPIIDVSGCIAGDDKAIREVATQIRTAMETVGFMVIVGHGVSPAVIKGAFEQARRYHARPAAAKLAEAMNEHNNGYMAQGRYAIVTSEHNETEEPELNEAFFFKRERRADDPDVRPGRRFVGPNIWPEDLPGFRDAALAYADALQGLAMNLLPAVATGLDLAPDYFDARFEKSQFSVRLSHYAPVPRAPDRFGIAPHSDSNFLTFLPQSEIAGLQVKTPEGHWEDVPEIAGSMAVNAGDTLHRWTNGRFKSTPHRALPPEHGHRYAIPFFFGPNIDTAIECLPSCTSAQNPPKWPTIVYEDWLLYWYDTNYNYTAQESQAVSTG